jgi:acetolactate synthase-1/2/3 large subunit
MADHAVHLIDIPIDYSENDEILNNQLPTLSAKI